MKSLPTSHHEELLTTLKTKKNYTITKNTHPLANTSVQPPVVLQYTRAVRRPVSPIAGLKHTDIDFIVYGAFCQKACKPDRGIETTGDTTHTIHDGSSEGL